MPWHQYQYRCATLCGLGPASNLVAQLTSGTFSAPVELECRGCWLHSAKRRFLCNRCGELVTKHDHIVCAVLEEISRKSQCREKYQHMDEIFKLRMATLPSPLAPIFPRESVVPGVIPGGTDDPV